MVPIPKKTVDIVAGGKRPDRALTMQRRSSSLIAGLRSEEEKKRDITSIKFAQRRREPRPESSRYRRDLVVVPLAAGGRLDREGKKHCTPSLR